MPRGARRALGAAAVVALGAFVAGTLVWLGRSLRSSTGPVGGLSAGRTKRSGRVASVTTRTGVDWATTRARSAFVSEGRGEELRQEFELRTAEQVSEALGEMKGALMKLGQMASYLDQGLPEPVREALAQLQSDAPPMSAELAASVVLEELGTRPEELFETWDPVPIAAASIGQVHRATTRDGREVAVKVQYPGVAEAIESDLGNTEMLFALLGMVFPGLDPEPIVEELAARVREELDYRLEAENQQLFADAYRGHPHIHVPAVLGELSTTRVLTTELAEGVRFSDLLEWPDSERQLAAETIYRFVFGSIYELHAFNGDPHPGNYLFREGGRVTFLDFGLCKRFTPAEVSQFEEMIRLMVLERDPARFGVLMERIGILPEGSGFSAEVVDEYFGHFYDFVLEHGVREMTPEYSSESVRRFFDLSGPYAEIMRSANLPASMVIIQRINLGLYALFGDLRARNDWRAIAEELWPFVSAEPSTQMGREAAEWRRSLHESDGAAEDRC